MHSVESYKLKIIVEARQVQVLSTKTKTRLNIIKIFFKVQVKDVNRRAIVYDKYIACKGTVLMFTSYQFVNVRTLLLQENFSFKLKLS